MADKQYANADRIDERELVERLKKGQQWAFTLLVNTYQARLLKIAYGITLDREESLEIVQDVFMSAFKHIASFREEASLSTWLRKITINQCLNWKRKWIRRFRWRHDPIETEADPRLLEETLKGSNPETALAAIQSEENIMKAVKKLPEKIRTVLVLNALEGMSYDDISKALGIKKGTVSSRLYFARKYLSDSLGPQR